MFLDGVVGWEKAEDVLCSLLYYFAIQDDYADHPPQPARHERVVGGDQASSSEWIYGITRTHTVLTFMFIFYCNKFFILYIIYLLNCT